MPIRATHAEFTPSPEPDGRTMKITLCQCNPLVGDVCRAMRSSAAGLRRRPLRRDPISSSSRNFSCRAILPAIFSISDGSSAGKRSARECRRMFGVAGSPARSLWGVRCRTICPTESSSIMRRFSLMAAARFFFSPSRFFPPTMFSMRRVTSTRTRTAVYPFKGESLGHQHLRRRMEPRGVLDGPPVRARSGKRARAKGRDHPHQHRRIAVFTWIRKTCGLRSAAATPRASASLCLRQSGRRQRRAHFRRKQHGLRCFRRACAPCSLLCRSDDDRRYRSFGPDAPAARTSTPEKRCGTRSCSAIRRLHAQMRLHEGHPRPFRGHRFRALTAARRAGARGEHVSGVAMPSRYSSQGSVADARVLAEHLGIRFSVIPIEPMFTAFLSSRFRRSLPEPRPGLAEENLQARIRGTLDGLSNKFGILLLTTGNKSELAVGYCTLYGDMSGGLSVISDLPKGMVYKLARFINSEAGREIIPESTSPNRHRPNCGPIRPTRTRCRPTRYWTPCSKGSWRRISRSLNLSPRDSMRTRPSGYAKQLLKANTSGGRRLRASR